MSWKDLIEDSPTTVIHPWTGENWLQIAERTWSLATRPPKHGWWQFEIRGRKAKPVKEVARNLPVKCFDLGYLVGDRFISDSDSECSVTAAQRVHFIEDGLDRFARIRVGRMYEGGPLIYVQQEMPLGPEGDAERAFEDECRDARIRGATPALYAALKLEFFHRDQVRKQRELAEKERQRRELAEKLGTGEGRRLLAAVDFETAARAALQVGGAEYLDHRKAARQNENVVRFRLDGRRYECTCDAKTMQIIDSGICLTAHYDDSEFEEGTRGDSFFTLESLPAVIREAIRTGKLVIYRHAED